MVWLHKNVKEAPTEQMYRGLNGLTSQNSSPEMESWLEQTFRAPTDSESSPPNDLSEESKQMRETADLSETMQSDSPDINLQLPSSMSMGTLSATEEQMMLELGY